MLRFASTLVMVCAAANGFQPPNGSVDSQREKDVYAIYSLMLANPGTTHSAEGNERLLIAVTTRSVDLDVKCMQPPKGRERAFRAALADYDRRKAIPRNLKPALTISKPYTFLTGDEVTAFIRERDSQLRGPLQSEPFRGATGFLSLSDVYFNRRGTLALAGLYWWCGGLCANGYWLMFEKLDTGKWRRIQAGCVVVAENFNPRRC